MFSMGGSPMGGGPSSNAANAAAGLPAAEVPGDLRNKVVEALAHEPEHLLGDVEWSVDDWERERFSLLAFLRPHRWRLLAAVGLVMVETLALQLGPVLTQIAIDDGVRGRSTSVVTSVALIYVVAVAIAAVAGWARVSYTGRLGERLSESLRIRVFGHMQRQGVGWYTDEKAGVLLTRMTSDIQALTMLFQEGVVNLLVQIFTLAMVTGALFYYDPLLASITLAVAVPPTLLSSLWFRRVSSVGFLRVRDRIAALLSHLQESLAGIRVIAAHNQRDRNVEEHRQVVDDHYQAQANTSRINAIYAPGTDMFGIATQATLLGVGAAMASSGRITVGELAAFVLFLSSFFAPIQSLVQLYNSHQQGDAAVVKLRQLLETEPEIRQSPQAHALPPIDGLIELDSVTFGYDPGRPVLMDLSIRIEPGETVAFVGETGAGKSTVARLLTRFHDPGQGSVRIDGHDLRDVTISSLRRQLGVVPQEAFLFAGVVRDNVAFARPEASDEELHAALDAVGVGDLVDRLGGLDAYVHERGVSLSAGERQLLALARAFVARPRVLILDEATSNLDLRSEAQVERALDVLLEGRTAVIIAHRLATARRADRIAVMDGGRIVELGNHDELVRRGGRYAAMYETWVRHGGAA